MEQKIKETISAILNVTIDNLDDDSGSQTLPEWDSANHLFIITALETAFNTSFAIEETLAMINIAEIKKILINKNISN
jgi:acyl carrier protein